MIFYRMSRVLFGFTSIFYHIAPTFSAVISAHRRRTSARNVSTYFTPRPLPPSNRCKPWHLSAGQFTRSTIFAARIVSRSCSSFSLHFSRDSSRKRGGKNKQLLLTKNIQQLKLVVLYCAAVFKPLIKLKVSAPLKASRDNNLACRFL